MKEKERLEDFEKEYEEMSSRAQLIALLLAIKKIVEESDNPAKDVEDYINEVLERI